MARSIDYATLTLKDALDVAILIEEEAAERYSELADQLEHHRTKEAASFFRHMVTNEGKHADALRERRSKVFGDEPRTVDPAIVPEIEAPAYDEVRAFVTPHFAGRVAMAAEVRAERFYAAALEQVTDPDVRSLFEDMHEEEVEHQERVQAFLDRLGPEDETDPDDVVDPPVSL